MKLEIKHMAGKKGQKKAASKASSKKTLKGGKKVGSTKLMSIIMPD